MATAFNTTITQPQSELPTPPAISLVFKYRLLHDLGAVFIPVDCVEDVATVDSFIQRQDSFRNIKRNDIFLLDDEDMNTPKRKTIGQEYALGYFKYDEIHSVLLFFITYQDYTFVHQFKPHNAYNNGTTPLGKLLDVMLSAFDQTALKLKTTVDEYLSSITFTNPSHHHTDNNHSTLKQELRNPNESLGNGGDEDDDNGFNIRRGKNGLATNKRQKPNNNLKNNNQINNTNNNNNTPLLPPITSLQFPSYNTPMAMLWNEEEDYLKLYQHKLDIQHVKKVIFDIIIDNGFYLCIETNSNNNTTNIGNSNANIKQQMNKDNTKGKKKKFVDSDDDDDFLFDDGDDNTRTTTNKGMQQQQHQQQNSNNKHINQNKAQFSLFFTKYFKDDFGPERFSIPIQRVEYQSLINAGISSSTTSTTTNGYNMGNSINHLFHYDNVFNKMILFHTVYRHWWDKHVSDFQLPHLLSQLKELKALLEEKDKKIGYLEQVIKNNRMNNNNNNNSSDLFGDNGDFSMLDGTTGGDDNLFDVVGASNNNTTANVTNSNSNNNNNANATLANNSSNNIIDTRELKRKTKQLNVRPGANLWGKKKRQAHDSDSDF